MTGVIAETGIQKLSMKFREIFPIFGEGLYKGTCNWDAYLLCKDLVSKDL